LKSASIRRFLSYAIALVGHFQRLSASEQNQENPRAVSGETLMADLPDRE
jgi:hypothetical protein